MFWPINVYRFENIWSLRKIAFTKLSRKRTKISPSLPQNQILSSYFVPRRLTVHTIFLLSVTFIPVDSRHLVLSSNDEIPINNEVKSEIYPSGLQRPRLDLQSNKILEIDNNARQVLYDGYPNFEDKGYLKTITSAVRPHHHKIDSLKVDNSIVIQNICIL